MKLYDSSPEGSVRRCRKCGKELRGRGRWAYCGPSCAYEFRLEQVREAVRTYTNKQSDDYRELKTYQRNAYRFLGRERLSRRGFCGSALAGTAIYLLGTQCDSWPLTRTAKHEEAARRFEKARQALLQGDRASVINDVAVLRAFLGRDNSAFASVVQTHCEELLRDVGEIADWSAESTDGISENAFLQTESRARRVEARWDMSRERLDYARAVLARVSLYRQRKGRERDVMKLVNGAEYILRGLSQYENRRMASLLLHHALSWKVRLRAFYLPERDLDAAAIEEDFQRLHELAEKSDSPIPAIVTARDEAAYWVLHDEFEKAGTILRQARSQYSVLPVKSVIADLALRRSEIELEVKQIKLGEKKAGGKEVRLVREYRDIWEQNPTAAQLKALRDLEKKCAVSPARVEGLRRVYSTPMPAELWMEDRLTAF